MSEYNLIDDYVSPDNVDDWLLCPNCGLKPKIWIFDNDRTTGCGCGGRYDHPYVQAESIRDCHDRTGNTKEHDSDALRKNWNHWVKTGEKLYERKSSHGK